MSERQSKKAAVAAVAVAEVVEATATAAKPTVEVQEITMTDGRVVRFAGKRRIIKTVEVDEAARSVKVIFDLVNGQTYTFVASEKNILQLAGHGAAQKIGDEAAGVESIDDVALAFEEAIARLDRGEWTVERTKGDGFSGASLVIKAICEAYNKDVPFVKEYLQKQLDDSKAKCAGTDQAPLTRAELYASCRSPNSKVGQIYARLEAESRSSKLRADDLFAGM